MERKLYIIFDRAAGKPLGDMFEAGTDGAAVRRFHNFCGYADDSSGFVLYRLGSFNAAGVYPVLVRLGTCEQPAED
jgi:hypothetical protein